MYWNTNFRWVSVCCFLSVFVCPMCVHNQTKKNADVQLIIYFGIQKRQLKTILHGVLKGRHAGERHCFQWTFI